MTPIDSGILAAYEYDAEKRELTIRFKNDGEYGYADVSPEKVKEFESAPSKGKFFFAHIKPHHAFTKKK